MHSCWLKARVAALLVVMLLCVGCNDVYRPIVTPIPLPGGDPGSADYAAVLSKNPSGAQDIVTFINVSGDTNVGNRLVGPGASWISWDGGRGRTIVPNTTLSTVSQVTFSSNASSTASLFPGSLPVFSFSRNSNNSYVLNKGTNSDCPSTGSIGVLLTSNNSLQENICVGPSPVYFTQTFDGARLIVLDDSLSEAWIINVNTNAIEAKLPVGSNPVWALTSTDSSTAYILNKGSNDLTVLDITNGAVKNASIPTNGNSPSFMVMDVRRTRLFVSNQGSDTVSVFDISHLTPVTLHAPVNVGAGSSPQALAVIADGSAVYVANTAANYVTRIDGNSYLTQQIPVSSSAGATVTWVAASVAGLKVYASVIEPTDTQNGTAIIRVTDNVVVTTIPAPQQDLNCVASATVTCPLMRPSQVASRQ
jgi:DNA-binding beta-propeller fold protein YncE